MANPSEISDAIKAIQSDVTTIVKGEIELAKAELMPQAKSVGIGAGLLGGAGYLGVNGVSLVFLGLSALLAHWFATAFGWAPFLAACMGLVIMAVVLFVLAGVLALLGKNKFAAAKGPQATVEQGQASVDAVKLALSRGQAQGEAEAEARKAARKAAPSITSGRTGPSFVPPGS